MLVILKAACLAIYGLALASLAGRLTGGPAHAMEIIAAVFLLTHALEVVFLQSKVRLYRGSLALSMLLTLLFGMLHWMPLARAQAGKK